MARSHEVGGDKGIREGTVSTKYVLRTSLRVTDLCVSSVECSNNITSCGQEFYYRM